LILDEKTGAVISFTASGDDDDHDHHDHDGDRH